MLRCSVFGLPVITGSANRVGAMGEVLVAESLRAAGWTVDCNHAIGDLSAHLAGRSLCIEVKTARENSRGQWCFTLYKKWQGRVCASITAVDYVVLLCVRRSGIVIPFVVPALALVGRRAVTISSDPRTYSGWLAQYRRRSIAL